MNEKLQGKKVLVVTIAVILAIILFAILARAWMTGIAQPDTHNQLTTWAIELVNGSDYPDIEKFKNDIINGSCGADNDEDIIPPGRLPVGYIHRYPIRDDLIQENLNFEYENLSKAKWEGIPGYLGIIEYYKNKEFSGEQRAYWFIGNISHLTEDMSSPAHTYRHPHGRPLDPWHWFDNMETFFVPKIINTIPSLGASAQYGGNTMNAWDYPELTRVAEIEYCRSNLSGCKYYYEDGHYDGFPSSPDEATTAHYQAAIESMKNGVEYAAGMLMTASEKLPPVITDLWGDNVLPCGFLYIDVQENRTQEIQYTVWVDGEERLTDEGASLDDNLEGPEDELPWKKVVEVAFADLQIGEAGGEKFCLTSVQGYAIGTAKLKNKNSCARPREGFFYS